MRTAMAVMVFLGIVGLAAADVRHGPDDAALVRYVGKEYYAYAAFRGPRELPGPLVSTALEKFEKSLAEGRGPEAAIGRACREKVIAHPFDLFAGGFAVGLAGTARDARMLIVARRTPAVDKFVEWVKTTYAKPGALVVKSETLEGAPALTVQSGGRVELVAAFPDGEVVLADRASEVVAALKLRKAGGGLSAEPAYSRMRGRVRAPAKAFAILTPGQPLFDLASETADNPQLMRAALMGLKTLSGNLLELSGDARTLALDSWLGLDSKSEGFAQLKLDRRFQFYKDRTIGSPAAIPGDAVAVLAGMQPSYDTREIPASGAYVGHEGAASNQQQWDVIKGQLQMQLGLAFDAEIVPWLGPESAVFVRPAGADVYEAGALIDTTDVAAAQGALEKAVRHLKIARNLPIEEAALGTTKLFVLKPSEAVKMAAAACVTDRHVVLGVSRALVEAVVQYPIKATGSEPYARLHAALGPKREVMMMWAQTAPLVTLLKKLAERRPPAEKPTFDTAIAMLESLDAVGAGLAMPEPEMVHMSFQVWKK